jgi:uncharacterized membrane-anchored protein
MLDFTQKQGKSLSYLIVALLFVMYLFYYEIRSSIANYVSFILQTSIGKTFGDFMSNNFYKAFNPSDWIGYIVYALGVLLLTVLGVHFHFKNKRYTCGVTFLLIGLVFVCAVANVVSNWLDWKAAERISRETMYFIISPFSLIFLLPALTAGQTKNQKS